MEHVILVNELDQEIGSMEKMEAHHKGVLHRAFSVILFNAKGQMLLQKRAAKKYHSGGLWTNTCCSHPLPGETITEAAHRKLIQEMGIDARPEFAFKFIYEAPLDHGLTEHELDYVLIGQYDGEVKSNPDEVDSWRFVDTNTLREEMRTYPDSFTKWFQLIVDHPQFKVAH